MKKIIKISFTALAVMLFLVPAKSFAQKWNNDPIHSGVHYIVRHVMTPMLGSFGSFKVEMNWNADNLDGASINATLDAGSVRMGIPDLEKHLKSPDFFSVEEYPTWTFESKSITKTAEGYVATGEFTIRGEQKVMEIPFQYAGSIQTKRGEKAGFTAEFSIDRTEFGINYDPDAQTIGKEVRIMVYLEMNKAK